MQVVDRVLRRQTSLVLGRTLAERVHLTVYCPTLLLLIVLLSRLSAIHYVTSFRQILIVGLAEAIRPFGVDGGVMSSTSTIGHLEAFLHAQASVGVLNTRQFHLRRHLHLPFFNALDLD